MYLVLYGCLSSITHFFGILISKTKKALIIRNLLEKKLKIAGIPDYIYNLTGQGKNDECLCLEKIQDKWSVYYLERGIKTTNEIFDSENDACQFLYDQLMN